MMIKTYEKTAENTTPIFLPESLEKHYLLGLDDERTTIHCVLWTIPKSPFFEPRFCFF
jgi:hypothetical protein